jgi:hypothetical protein
VPPLPPAATVCNAGWGLLSPQAYSCDECQRGQASPGGPDAKCAACPEGQYASSPGLSTCNDCSVGSYSSAPGAESCTLCELGLISTVPGAKSCQACPTGLTTTTTGSSACTGGSCDATKLHVYAAAMTLDHLCTRYLFLASAACMPGYAKSSDGCDICPAGTASPGGAAASCLSCQPGTYSSTEGTDICKPCPAGSFTLLSGSMSCTGKEEFMCITRCHSLSMCASYRQRLPDACRHSTAAGH